jgi:seryl-tRNA synthetase
MPEETGTPTPTQEETPKTYTQDELNKIIGARLDRERKKLSEQYADYDALKADAEAYREIQEAQKSELEKAMEKIAALESEKAARKAADEHNELVKKVRAEHSVDAEFAPLLTGKTEEELNAQAELIGKRFAEPSKNERSAPAAVDVPDAELREFARRFLNKPGE